MTEIKKPQIFTVNVAFGLIASIAIIVFRLWTTVDAVPKMQDQITVLDQQVENIEREMVRIEKHDTALEHLSSRQNGDDVRYMKVESLIDSVEEIKAGQKEAASMIRELMEEIYRAKREN